MKTHFPLFLSTLVLAGLTSGCGTAPDSASAGAPWRLEPQPQNGPLSFRDGNCALTVTQEARNPRVAFPRDEILEGAYQKPAEAGVTSHRLRFFDDGNRVEVLPDGARFPKGAKGVLERATMTERVYCLNEGLFAGGRLTVEARSGALFATLTVFGSGEPVLSSVRGPLARD